MPSSLVVQFVARMNVSGTILPGCLAIKYDLSIISEENGCNGTEAVKPGLRIR